MLWKANSARQTTATRMASTTSVPPRPWRLSLAPSENAREAKIVPSPAT
jgi:hypothetical protein